MKRFLLFVLAVNLMIPAFAHKYLQHGLSWQHILQRGEYFETQTLWGDTIINGKEYLRSQGLFLRDDSTGLYFYSQRCDSDYVLFQYGAEVGDTILLFNSQYPRSGTIVEFCDADDWGYWEGSYGIVTSVDTILLLNGEPRRRIFYQSSMFMGTKWYIEGIGGFRGIKGENYDSEGYLAEMLCCYIGDTLLWARDDCELWQSTYPNACLGYTPPVCADTWHAISYENAYGSIRVTGVQYNLASDTVLNGRYYRKLMENNRICVGGIRQSEDGVKVYFHGISLWSYTPDMQECLLYDFSANVGDTLTDVYFRKEDMTSYIDCMGEPESLGWIVTEKDTIDGRIHMAVERYYADSDSSIVMYDHDKYAFKTYWIQGVGTPNVLWPTRYGTKSFSILYTLCAMHGDEILYSYNLESLKIENNCTEWHFTALDDIQADDSKVRKFIRDGQLLIETPLGTFNARGQLIE